MILYDICLFLIQNHENENVKAAGPRYIASERTAQKTPLPRVTPLLRATQPLLLLFVWLYSSYLEQICHSNFRKIT
jgi:hypothetical protein